MSFIRNGLPVLVVCLLMLGDRYAPADDQAVNYRLQLTLRHQVETSEGSGRFHQLTRDEAWDPQRTAVIVCDVWDAHHCLNAVRRLEEMLFEMNWTLHQLRGDGVTVIHAPSDCMEFYEGHPARVRALETPAAAEHPEEIETWCYKIPSEEQGIYPIDQTDGGEDDDLAEHKAWHEELAARGVDPLAPWTRQHADIDVDDERDFVTCEGDIVWNILEDRDIDNVILLGVHTNMCVLGRPFGLRRMAENGKNVVLMRDLTDTMYNPQRWPYVSHFTGTDLIVSHIERWVCPTITSNQIKEQLRPFSVEDLDIPYRSGSFPIWHPQRFSLDTRPRLAIVIAEDEYETNVTLPDFAARWLGKDFQVTFIYGNGDERHDLPGIEALREADAMLLSVRRRPLPAEQLDIIREFVASGKPVIGIRTASHAFCLRNQPPPEGLADWPELDAQVFGGSYSNHYANDLIATVTAADDAHPLLTGVGSFPYEAGGSLYVVSPINESAEVVLMGEVSGQSPEPMAWTFTRADGGRSFYTSLGYKDNFSGDVLPRLLYNACLWACEREIPDEFTPSPIEIQTAMP